MLRLQRLDPRQQLLIALDDPQRPLPPRLETGQDQSSHERVPAHERCVIQRFEAEPLAGLVDKGLTPHTPAARSGCRSWGAAAAIHIVSLIQFFDGSRAIRKDEDIATLLL
jgi:hypothetical protein